MFEISITILLLKIFMFGTFLSFIGQALGLSTTNTINCGIWAFNGKQPPNLAMLKILGIYNMTRGEDSCGIAIDDNLYKGVGNEANWVEFCEKNILPVPTTNTCIAHARKSTMGAKTKSQAHPFAYYTEDKDRPYAIAAHNGIIRNIDELKQKYPVYKNRKVEVDSIFFLNILIDSKHAPENIKVLNDYEGFAACLWYYPGDDTLFVFRGKSDSGETSTGERPLYYWKSSAGVYISSMKEALKAICEDSHDNIKEFEPNVIHAIKDGVISKLKVEIKRESKNKTVTTTYKNDKDKAPEDIFKGFPEKALNKLKKLDNKKKFDGEKYWLEAEPYFNDFKDGRVIYSAGRYYYNNNILGTDLSIGEELVLDINGIEQSCAKFNGSGEKYYFWNGWLCRSKKSLDIITSLYKDKKSELFSKMHGREWDTQFLTKHIKGIVFDEYHSGGYYNYCQSDNGATGTYYTGKFKPEFNQGKEYDFSSGNFKGVEYTKPELIVPDNTPVAAASIALPESHARSWDIESVNTLGEIKEQLEAAKVHTDKLISENKLVNCNGIINKANTVINESLTFVSSNYKRLLEKGELEEEVIVEEVM